MIRQATIDDRTGLNKLFGEYSPKVIEKLGLSYNVESCEDLLDKLIKRYIVMVLEKNKEIVGGLAGVILPSFVDMRIVVFQEIFFYVKPENRNESVDLLKETEKLCRDKGLNIMIMGSILTNHSEIMGRFYTRKGYNEFETHYLKGLT